MSGGGGSVNLKNPEKHVSHVKVLDIWKGVDRLKILSSVYGNISLNFSNSPTLFDFNLEIICLNFMLLFIYITPNS